MAFSQIHDSECANFRDRVYALLSVMEWEWITYDSKLQIHPDYSITKLGLIVQVIEAIPGIRLHYSKLRAIVGSLYRTLRFSPTDYEISALLERRHPLSIARTTGDGTLPPLGLGRSGLSCWMLDCVRLELSSGAWTLPRAEVVFPSIATQEQENLEQLSTLDLTRLQIKHQGKVAGWVCPQAFPGDYLIIDRNISEDPYPDPQLIVRRTSRDTVYEIIGHAILYGDVVTSKISRGVVTREYSCEPIVQFNIEDYIVLTALRHSVEKKKITGLELLELLKTSPTRSRFSSWALIGSLCSAES